MLPTGVIHVEAGKRWRPVVQHANEAALRNVLSNLLFKCESNADSSERRLNHQVGIIDYERTIHADRDRLSAFLEFPPIWTARKAQAYASMVI